WEDDPSGYQFTAYLVGGIVLSSGENFADEEDMFAAFDMADNLRGLAVQLDGFGPTTGQIIYEMTIRSNDVGDILSFKYYDASEDAVFNICETFTFVSNYQLGDLIDPYIFTILTDMPPDLFQYIQSMTQAFYLFPNVTIDGIVVESNDWVGAFNGEVCVGAHQWCTSQCGGGVCGVPAMGYDGSDATEGYMSEGGIPSFKIYIASNDMYYDAEVSGTVEVPNSCLGEAPDCME
ncbi:uncharacterized protein METZ01_LOCUS503101, partial [marine metagenome]